MKTKPTSMDEYLETVEPEKRLALNKLRTTIHSLVPGLEECISYSMPAFRKDGHVIGGFQATKQGCSYYPFSGSTLSTLGADLVGYSMTKSALHFSTEKGLPKALVAKLLKARIREVSTKRKS
jgi:uncharacterized protein YdhG (YjbR/CyaY superfamily)